MSPKELERRRKFMAAIMALAEREDLPVFAVTDGASVTRNNGNPYIKQLRENHASYERSIGDDPNHDWSRK